MITEVLLGALLFLACHIFYTIYCLHTIVYLYYANKYYANKERSGTTNWNQKLILRAMYPIYHFPSNDEANVLDFVTCPSNMTWVLWH